MDGLQSAFRDWRDGSAVRGEEKKYSIGPGVWTSSEIGEKPIGDWQVSPPRVASAEAADPR